MRRAALKNNEKRLERDHIPIYTVLTIGFSAIKRLIGEVNQSINRHAFFTRTAIAHTDTDTRIESNLLINFELSLIKLLANLFRDFM